MINKNEKINLIENIEKVKLDNGLKVIIDHIENYKSSSISFYLLNGSRDENNKQLGYSHFSEHMVFKGTEQFNQKELSLIFDKMGGYINAYTTHELTSIYNRIPDYYLEDTIELMSDIFNNSVFSPDEIEVEKDVIINEIQGEYEDAHEKVYEYFMENIFPDNSLGLPIIGNEKSIQNVTRNELYNFYNNRFNSDNLIIVISGNINTDKIIGNLNKIKFRREKEKIITRKANHNKNKLFFNSHPSELVHIVIGTASFKINITNYIKISLLNIILGESMSSRFYQKIREELGLCYSIYTFFNKYRKENLFGLYLSVLPKYVKKSVDEVSKIIFKLKQKGINKTELDNAKKQIIGKIILNSDQLNKRVQRLAFLEINYEKYISLNDIIEQIKSVTIEELNNIINELFIDSNFVTQVLYKENIDIGEFRF